MATSYVRAEQRTTIKFCYESGLLPVDILKQANQVKRHRNVPRAFVYMLFSRYRDRMPAEERMGRPPLKNAGNVLKREGKLCLTLLN